MAILAAVSARGRAGLSGKLAGWLLFVGIFAVLSYASNLTDSGDEPSVDFVYTWAASVLGTVQVVVMLGIAAWIAAGAPTREIFALRRPPSWTRAIALALGLLVLALVLSVLLEQVLPAGEEQGLTPEGWDPDRAPQFAASFVVIVGIAPLAEELIFRGLGMSLLLAHLSAPLAVVANGLLFALAHGLLFGVPVLALFGIALAIIRVRTGSVWPCLVTHSLFNAFAMIAAVTVE